VVWIIGELIILVALMLFGVPDNIFPKVAVAVLVILPPLIRIGKIVTITMVGMVPNSATIIVPVAPVFIPVTLLPIFQLILALAEVGSDLIQHFQQLSLTRMAAMSGHILILWIMLIIWAIG
jgi:hypothetical protein